MGRLPDLQFVLPLAGNSFQVERNAMAKLDLARTDQEFAEAVLELATLRGFTVVVKARYFDAEAWAEAQERHDEDVRGD